MILLVKETIPEILNTTHREAIGSLIQAIEDAGHIASNVEMYYLSDSNEILTEIVGLAESLDSASLILNEGLYEFLEDPQEIGGTVTVYFMPSYLVPKALHRLFYDLHNEGLTSIYPAMKERIEEGIGNPTESQLT